MLPGNQPGESTVNCHQKNPESKEDKSGPLQGYLLSAHHAPGTMLGAF